MRRKAHKRRNQTHNSGETLKISVEFNLPEDGDEFEAHLKAVDMQSAIEDFRRWLRDTEKYGEDKVLVEVVREHFYETFSGLLVD